MKTISVIFGTRPEAIKMAPVILALRQLRSIRCHVCVTAQHREMLDQVLEVFNLDPDVDLDLMTPNQTLADFTSRAMVALDRYLAKFEPDMVLVQGDTTTALCGSLAAFYRHIPVGHVEAGLRTWNMNAPWPEEANRVLTSRLATLHFAPTSWSRKNLRNEGVPAARIQVTGNPVVDALRLARDKVRACVPEIPGLPPLLQSRRRRDGKSTDAPRIVLITGHRRESFGKGFENICRAIVKLAARYRDVHFVYPVHLNPKVRNPVMRILGPSAGRQPGRTVMDPRRRIHLIEPLSYLPFIALMDRSHLVLTDSGGIQEEAPSLGKPVLVMRDVTERPEGVRSGAVALVGTATGSIVKGVSALLDNPSHYRKMARARNPYGSGTAGPAIAAACMRFLRSR